MKYVPLVAILALVFSTVPVSAIALDTTTGVMIGAPAERLGDAPLVLPVLVEYTHPPTVALAPTAVMLHIAEPPEWLRASISPSTVFFDVSATQGPGLQHRQYAQAMLTIVATADAPADDAFTLVITAASTVNSALKASSAKGEVLIVTENADAAPLPCTEAHAESDNPSEVTTQSSAVSPVASSIVGFLALAGSGLGAVVAYRRREN